MRVIVSRFRGFDLLDQDEKPSGRSSLPCRRSSELTQAKDHGQWQKLDARESGSFRIGDNIEIYRLGFGAMRLAGPGIWAKTLRSLVQWTGASLTVIIALVTIGFQLADPVYRTVIIGVAIWYALRLARCGLTLLPPKFAAPSAVSFSNHSVQQTKNAKVPKEAGRFDAEFVGTVGSRPTLPPRATCSARTLLAPRNRLLQTARSRRLIPLE